MISNNSGVQTFEWSDALLIFDQKFYPKELADELLCNLTQNIAWKQGEITMFGKKVLEPRLTAWYGDEGRRYIYSGKTNEALPWIQELDEMKKQIEQHPSALSLGAQFNFVLLNFYRNGNDSMGFHSDQEPELGKNPIIASVSLGEPRRFRFRHRDNKDQKHEIELTHGSLLVMAGAMQHHWTHGVPKEPKKMNPRINLTFRKIVQEKSN